jgi:integrase/recombinase XerD
VNDLAPLSSAPSIQSGAKSDDQLIQLWLHQKSTHTQRAYRSDVERFRAFVQKPLQAVTVLDIQSFEISNDNLSPASKARTLSSIKSLLTFANRVGYVQFNVGAVVQLPKIKNELANRLMEERDVILLIELEPSERNKSILEVLYFGGCRISEVVGLSWNDVQPNKESGQITVFGKGGKTRVIRLPERVYRRLQALRGSASPSDPVFVSRLNKRISAEMVHQIVTKAAKRAGIDKNVSAHWLRHAHASHSLDNGAPIHLVQATLGHSSLTTTSRYVHAKPNESSGMYLKAKE